MSFLVALAFLMDEFFDQGSEKRINAYHRDVVEVCRADVGVDVHRSNVGGPVRAEIVGDAGWNPHSSQRWHDPA